jgi:hypothetical protein
LEQHGRAVTEENKRMACIKTLCDDAVMTCAAESIAAIAAIAAIADMLADRAAAQWRALSGHPGGCCFAIFFVAICASSSAHWPVFF